MDADGYVENHADLAASLKDTLESEDTGKEAKDRLQRIQPRDKETYKTHDKRLTEIRDQIRGLLPQVTYSDASPSRKRKFVCEDAGMSRGCLLSSKCQRIGFVQTWQTPPYPLIKSLSSKDSEPFMMSEKTFGAILIEAPGHHETNELVYLLEQKMKTDLNKKTQACINYRNQSSTTLIKQNYDIVLGNRKFQDNAMSLPVFCVSCPHSRHGG
jgi:hypothetical protein